MYIAEVGHYPGGGGGGGVSECSLRSSLPMDRLQTHRCFLSVGVSTAG